MHVQIVNFNLKDMTDAEFHSMANEVAPAFASVPGLLGKIWLADAGKNTYGGSTSGRTRLLCRLTWPQTWVKASRHDFAT